MLVFGFGCGFHMRRSTAHHIDQHGRKAGGGFTLVFNQFILSRRLFLIALTDTAFITVADLDRCGVRDLSLVATSSLALASTCQR
jgi:hypothetical protein